MSVYRKKIIKLVVITAVILGSFSVVQKTFAAPPETVVPDLTFTYGNGFDATARTVARQDNGQYVIGGDFSQYDSTPAPHLIRLDNDGIPDSAFLSNIGAGPDGSVSNVLIQADGKIVVVGSFTHFDNNVAPGVIRLNSSGTIDTSFLSNLKTFDTTSITSSLVLPGGKILILGQFNTYDGAPASNILVLNADGTVDTNFSSGTGFDGATTAAVVSLDQSSIVIIGNFTHYNNNDAHYMATISLAGVFQNFNMSSWL